MIQVGDTEMDLVEIGARILNKIRTMAADYLSPIRRAVVTVPAYFNDRQRQAVKEAGERFEREVIRVVNEPRLRRWPTASRKDVHQAIYDLVVARLMSQ